MNIVYFDVETKHLAEEVGGWDYIERFGLAVAVTYSTRRGTFAHYTEQSVDELIDDLLSADLVVGFNILRFDYRVLRPYTQHDLRRLPTLDILVDLTNRLGHRVKLESCALGTLGAAKLGDGKLAVQWFRQGKLPQLIDYCKQDVDIVRRLHEHGRNHRHILIRDPYRGLIRVPVDW